MIIILVIIAVILLSSVKQINQYERGVLFTIGKYTKILNPGWRIVLPIIHSYKKVDIRTKQSMSPNKMPLPKITYQ